MRFGLALAWAPIVASTSALLLFIAPLLPIDSMASASIPGLPAGGVPAEVHVGEGSDGTSVRLVRGQTLLLTLPSQPTTGYAWELDAFDRGVLRESSAPEPIPGSGGLGSTGLIRFRFHATGSGSTSLQLNYRRGFEPPSTPPRKRFRIQVRVP